ncbi:TonB-dependent receptor [Noviherbaspirillum sedimenti]|uniref:Plug domain-containing protein n=1 Tax=Noviherbaspirillum sedimenti TaxID=2320865 RepID=A0A3A3G4N8_9BURK|nr:Plug domain-containing protein [Noviherbaspirillum sedimenti]RJF96451.1 Plug domain-containing protein [Noviherbaspirillum sedimenti]
MPHSTLPQLHRRHAASRTPPLLAAAFCVPVLAQAGELAARPEATLTPIQVVAKTPVPGLGIERDLLPYPVQTASADALRQAQAGNLIDFLATNLTGVNVNEVQGSPFQNDITFRGFRASPILGSAQGLSAYLDGVRVNEPFGDVVNWDMLPEAAIADLTLVPGSNPLYGFNTLGGALAFTTKSGRSHPGMDAEISYGSNARKRIDAGYGARFDNGLHAFVATTLFRKWLARAFRRTHGQPVCQGRPRFGPDPMACLGPAWRQQADRQRPFAELPLGRWHAGERLVRKRPARGLHPPGSNQQSTAAGSLQSASLDQ